nr:MAG TPA: major capsid protein [Caudoviricetes sp.]
MDYDFCGWATKSNIKCSDGRTIMPGAFKDCDGQSVPLVWNHQHNSLNNVLGHAVLKNCKDGVYAYCSFNDTDDGRRAKELVTHKDVNALSIYANELKQEHGNVRHGKIREVSLVLAGANPGAMIKQVICHSDDGDYELDEAEIYNEANSISMNDESETNNMAGTMAHADDQNKQPSDRTVQDVIDSMTEEQKKVLFYCVGVAAEGAADESDENDEDDMKHNVFDDDYDEQDTLMHGADADFATIMGDVKRYGSLSESMMAHGVDLDSINTSDVMMHAGVAGTDYGIKDIDMLFPDYKTTTNVPGFVQRDMGWVAGVMNGTSHTPFARIKSVFASITEDDARARGYIKGKLKKEEVFTLLKRTTDPQTVYKKQKLDRDDVTDITDFDVVVWLKSEMRMMLDEEIARAILVGDGRTPAAEDKIQETHIRSVWNDDPFYSIKGTMKFAAEPTFDELAEAFIEKAIRIRKEYKGTGNPTLYTTEDMLTNMLLLKDKIGHFIYKNVSELATTLRVANIVTVPVMESLTRTPGSTETTLTGKKPALDGIIVNLKDYNIGADKGGAVSMFDDFDIDYNQQKYLIETRCSGALTVPYSAIVLEHYIDPGK